MTSDTDFSLRRIAVAAFGPSVLYGIGEGAILPVIPLSARALEASVPVTALMVTLIGIGSLLSNIPASLITMHRGERWALVAAALWCAIALALCGGAWHPGVLAVGCFMVGMSQAVFTLARQSYLAEIVPIAFRARAMSTLGGSQRIGMFIGPFAAAAAIHAFGLVGAYGVAVVALLAAGALAGGMRDLQRRTSAASPEADEPARPRVSLRATLHAHRHVYFTLGVGVFLVAAVRATRQVAIPLWADHLLIDASTTSVIVGVAGAVDMLLFYPAGKVMDLLGRRWVVLPAMLIMGAGLLALPWTQGATGLLIVAMAIGFGNGIGSGMVMTLGADHSPSGARAQFLGGWRLMADVGATCGPALLSLLAAVLSLGAGIAAIGLASFAAAAQLGYWIPRVRRPH